MAGAILLFGGSAAEAAGLWNLDRGASHYARGGANIAAPRDPIALYTNPAALAGLRGMMFMADGNAIWDNRRFTRASDDINDDGLPEEYLPAENTNPTFPPSPGFFLTYNLEQLGLPELTVGAGGWGPPRSDTTWPHEGPQRYSIMESHNLQVHYGVGAAYALPFLGLKVGVTGMMINQIIDTSLRLSALPELARGDNRFDAEVWVEAEDNWIPGAVIGVSAQPLPYLILASSVQLPWNVDARGKADIRMVGAGLEAVGAEVEGENVGIKLQMPALIRVAVQYLDPDDRFDVELAGVMETWSRNKQITFVPDGIVLKVNSFGTESDVGKITFDTNYRDTFSVRLGGRYELLEDFLTIRAGTYFERSAVAPEYLSPSSFDTNRTGFTLGARVDLPHGIWVDLATGLVLWAPTEISDSKILLKHPITGDGQFPIGNGKYENRQVYMLAAAGIALPI